MNKSNTFTIYIEQQWINGDFDFYNIKNYYEQLHAKQYISKKRKEFITKLQNEGFNITFNKKDINDDTICLIMDDTSLCNENIPIQEYKKIFDQKIFKSAGPNLNYPFSLTIKEYFNNPFFPAVFKNELTNGGHDKFLIETNEQLEIIKDFYNKHYNNPIYKEAFDCSIFQQYLETPSKYTTYLRVLVAASGDIMGASLKYSNQISTNNNLTGLFEDIFLNPNSKYFINTKKMFNYYSNGENISFSQPKFSQEKTTILEAHGFDHQNLTLPNSVVDVCKNIMENCNREIGILCGIDFILNNYDKKWYYLENQAFPAIEEWAWTKEINLPKVHNLKGYLKYLELELQTRYESLMLLVNKKQNKISQPKTLKLNKK